MSKISSHISSSSHTSESEVVAQMDLHGDEMTDAAEKNLIRDMQQVPVAVDRSGIQVEKTDEAKMIAAATDAGWKVWPQCQKKLLTRIMDLELCIMIRITCASVCVSLQLDMFDGAWYTSKEIRVIVAKDMVHYTNRPLSYKMPFIALSPTKCKMTTNRNAYTATIDDGDLVWDDDDVWQRVCSQHWERKTIYIALESTIISHLKCGIMKFENT